jgi:hypothetical protein
MSHEGHGAFGGRRSATPDALLRDALTAAREEFELHELLVGSDWQDEIAREMRDRVAPEFFARRERTDAGVVQEAADAAEERAARQGAGWVDLRAYQLLLDLVRTGARA